LCHGGLAVNENDILKGTNSNDAILVGIAVNKDKKEDQGYDITCADNYSFKTWKEILVSDNNQQFDRVYDIKGQTNPYSMSEIPMDCLNGEFAKEYRVDEYIWDEYSRRTKEFIDYDPFAKTLGGVHNHNAGVFVELDKGAANIVRPNVEMITWFDVIEAQCQKSNGSIYRVYTNDSPLITKFKQFLTYGKTPINCVKDMAKYCINGKIVFKSCKFSRARHTNRYVRFVADV